jgi:hypothetical protein
LAHPGHGRRQHDGPVDGPEWSLVAVDRFDQGLKFFLVEKTDLRAGANWRTPHPKAGVFPAPPLALEVIEDLREQLQGVRTGMRRRALPDHLGGQRFDLTTPDPIDPSSRSISSAA